MLAMLDMKGTDKNCNRYPVSHDLAVHAILPQIRLSVSPMLAYDVLLSTHATGKEGCHNRWRLFHNRCHPPAAGPGNDVLSEN